MRVAFFHHYSLTHGGGGERFLAELADFLVLQGHEVSIHALPFRRRDVAVELDPGVEYCEGLVHRTEADVAYHMYAPLMHYAFLCRGPKIAGLHGAVVADYASSGAFYVRQGPFVAGAYLARETVGRYDLHQFDAVHSVTPVALAHRRHFVLPNWVDRSNTPRALGLKQERGATFAVLYVGKPSYTKGFDTVVTLSEQLAGDGLEFWVACPPDPLVTGCKSLKWVGYVPPEEIWQLYARAAVLLHPTRQETFGRAILESLAAGTPVVTTPIPSHQALDLPLEFAASVPETRERIEAIHERWETDYRGYVHAAEAAAQEAGRFDRRTVLPQYERMLSDVAAGAGS